MSTEIRSLTSFSLIEKQLDIPFFGCLTLSSEQVPQGRHNQTTILCNAQNDKFVHKRRKIEQTHLDLLSSELSYIGFSRLGGSFSIRQLSEVEEFMNSLFLKELYVSPPVVVGENFLLLPFIEGRSLKEMLASGDTSPIENLLKDIFNVHRNNVVYGDRWPKNIIVTPEGSIAHIDFDINISGPNTKELELALIFFSVIRDASNKGEAVQKLISSISPQELKMYDLRIVKDFVLNFAKYFALYGNIDIRTSVDEFIKSFMTKLN